jgi:putative ABC transport system permease protein
MNLGFYWRYATRSLIRGGQRTVLAIFCVAVGVMAIVALQLVGLSVNRALVSNIIEANGGDLRLRTLDLVPLHDSDLANFEQLKQQGRIYDYATSFVVGGDITTSTGDNASFNVLAVSPSYPLIGQPDFVLPQHDLTIQQIVKNDSVAISQDSARAIHAQVGSRFTIKTEDGRLIPITIGAIFKDGGAFFSGEVVIAQSTLHAAAGPNGQLLPVEYTSVTMTAPSSQVNSVAEQLQKEFPTGRVITANDLLKQRQTQVDQIHLFLHLVGLLALFIGGVGIINTMQVLLRRRRVEIAMLKASGYRRSDLYALFGVEAGILGAIGGITGTAAGLGASFLVRSVVERAFFLHLPVVIDAFSLLTGIIVGVLTALIFGVLPIVQSSQVRPLAVLRDNDESGRSFSRIAYVGLLALLSLLFVGLAALILQNLVAATAAVYGGLIAVGALGVCFSVLIWAIARLPVYESPTLRILLWMLGAIGSALGCLLAFGLLAVVGGIAAAKLGIVGIIILVLLGGMGIILASCGFVFMLATLIDALVMFLPKSWKTIVMLAYRNIGRQRVRTTTMLTALFVGVFGIGMVVTLGQGIRETIDATIASALHYNVFIITPPFGASATRSALGSVPGVDANQSVESLVGRVKPVDAAGFHDTDLITQLRKSDDVEALSTIEGFDLKEGVPVLTIKAGRNLNANDVGTNHAVLSAFLMLAPYHLKAGDTVTVASSDGKTVETLTIVGFYDDSSPGGNPNFGRLLTDSSVAQRLTGIAQLTIFSLHIAPSVLPVLRRTLAQQAPSATVFSLVDLTALIDQVLTNLIIMMTTIASLAMLAGLIIIANAVALAMLERRREIGILKSVGHTSRSILATILVENGLVGFLGALVAMLLVVGAIEALGTFYLKISLLISPWLVIGIIMLTACITMAVAIFVAWNAARVRPLEVLRYE